MRANLEASGRPAPPTGDIYEQVDFPEAHPDRARSILAAHPEVRSLLGVNRWTALLAVGVVGLQFGLAALSLRLPWWGTVLLAYGVGAYINHALWVIVHETAHHLIFRRPALNRCITVLCNLPMVVPATVMFCVYHLMHHRHMGEFDRDADLPRRGLECWLLQHGFAGRLAWQCLYPLVQSIRTLCLDNGIRNPSWMRWVGPSIAAVLAFDALLYWQAGPYIFAYLLLSVFFSIGPHPLGARWIQEHYRFREGQETYSYYGSLNIVALNVGYHNEHHDLTQVPWHRLPKLRAMAPEMYEPLYAHASWVRLWLRFLFDSRLEIIRLVRAGAEHAPLEGSAARTIAAQAAALRQPGVGGPAATSGAVPIPHLAVGSSCAAELTTRDA